MKHCSIGWLSSEVEWFEFEFEAAEDGIGTICYLPKTCFNVDFGKVDHFYYEALQHWVVVLSWWFEFEAAKVCVGTICYLPKT